MAFLDSPAESRRLSLDPNRADVAGAMLSVSLPLAGLVIVRSAAEVLGLELAQASAIEIATLLAVFASLGIARWFAVQAGERGKPASWWIVALTIWLMGAPLVGAGLDEFFRILLDIATLVLAIGVSIRAASVSRGACLFTLPATVLAAIVAIPGYVLVTSGWSPGFAVAAGAAYADD